MSADVYLYLETCGRKTGLPRKIEIWFVAHDARYYLIAEQRERAQWVQNIKADSQVRFSVGTRDAPEAQLPSTTALARILDERQAGALIAQVKALADAKYDWSDGLIVELAPQVTA